MRIMFGLDGYTATIWLSVPSFRQGWYIPYIDDEIVSCSICGNGHNTTQTNGIYAMNLYLIDRHSPDLENHSWLLAPHQCHWSSCNRIQPAQQCTVRGQLVMDGWLKQMHPEILSTWTVEPFSVSKSKTRVTTLQTNHPLQTASGTC